MPVRLRLRRMGKKRQPIYKVVAADSRSPRDGKFLESIGLYNPKANPHILEIDEDKANRWLNNGAQPTLTVQSLLSQSGILLKRELRKRGLAEEEVVKQFDAWKAENAAKAKTRKKASKGKKTNS